MARVISGRDGASVVIAYYVRGIGGRLISNVQTAGTRYYHFDGLGSVVALTDSAGAKVSSYTYDEFGVLKQSTGQSWNNFQYTSSIHDASPGLYLMGSRYYDPALGRFITQDTWGGNAYDPWTRNLYAYGRGNPMSFVDPTGHGGVLSNGVYVDCSPEDLQLLEYKLAHARATTQKERDEIAAAAEQYRSEHPGYTVTADKTLDYYMQLNSTSSADAPGSGVDTEDPHYRDLNLTVVLPVFGPVGLGVTGGAAYDIERQQMYEYRGWIFGLVGLSGSLQEGPGNLAPGNYYFLQFTFLFYSGQIVAPEGGAGVYEQGISLPTPLGFGIGGYTMWPVYNWQQPVGEVVPLREP